MVPVGVCIHQHIDMRSRGNGVAHRVQHLASKLQVEECVDEQRYLAIGNDARVAPSPGAVWLEIGVYIVAEAMQPPAVLPTAHIFCLTFFAANRSGRTYY